MCADMNRRRWPSGLLCSHHKEAGSPSHRGWYCPFARSRCSHAGGARWARRTRGTGPESCKLCAGLARRDSRSAPGRSPGAAAGRAPGCSGGAEGGVSGRRSPGQRAALFTAGPPSSQPAPCALLTSFILALSPAFSCSQP